MLRRLLASILSRWADVALINALALEREDHRATKVELAQSQSQLRLRDAEIEALGEWRERELSRLKAESAIFRGRIVLATEVPASNLDHGA